VLIKKQIERRQNGRRSWPASLKLGKSTQKSESMRMYKRLKLSKHATKLMTPQLILSAVTSTLAANNLQALSEP
jgi:hypothetical protein